MFTKTLGKTIFLSTQVNTGEHGKTLVNTCKHMEKFSFDSVPSLNFLELCVPGHPESPEPPAPGLIMKTVDFHHDPGAFLVFFSVVSDWIPADVLTCLIVPSCSRNFRLVAAKLAQPGLDRSGGPAWPGSFQITSV